jgi:F0F1-type ATP synthase assembly protein I
MEHDSGQPTTPGRPDRPGRGGGGAGRHVGSGLQFVVIILLFLYLGQWLDRRFGTDPWLLLLCVFAGAAGGFYSLYRTLMRDLRRDEQGKR